MDGPTRGTARGGTSWRSAAPASPEDAVHLAYLVTDMAEKHNLRDKHPSLVADLTATATTWRRDAERNSQRRHTNQR